MISVVSRVVVSNMEGIDTTLGVVEQGLCQRTGETSDRYEEYKRPGLTS